MLLGGHRHRGHVHEAGELAVIAEGARAVGGGQLLGPGKVHVRDAHHVDVPELHEGEDVVLPHVAGAHHTGAQPRLGHRAHSTLSGRSAPSGSAAAPDTMPRLDPSMKAAMRRPTEPSPNSSRRRTTAAPVASPER